MNTLDVDLAVVGSGFAGSLTALVARRLGLRVALLERGRHPRFSIGESSSPMANLLLEEIARRHGLDRLLPFCQWGSWQREHPGIGCGLKRGFSFFRHEERSPFSPGADRENELLVAASPNDNVADTHWYRPDFDSFLVAEAIQEGAEFLDLARVSIDRLEPGAIELAVDRDHTRTLVRARFLVDASGPRGFLFHEGVVDGSPLPGVPETQGLWAHFRDVPSFASFAAPDPPYPVDDSAVHHLFDDGWIWVLRFANGLTSAGVSIRSEAARAMMLEEGEPAWRRLLARFPSLAASFSGAKNTTPFVHAPRISWRAARSAGPGWALVPSAAGFVDPLLSTGIPLALFGILRLGEMLKESAIPTAEQLDRYSDLTSRELDRTARLIGAMLDSLGDFRKFSALSMFYFAAASFSEAAWRLDSPRKSREFLLGDDARFAARFERVVSSPGHPHGFEDDVRHAIEPWNVAGLLDPARKNAFDVRRDDLLAGAEKLAVSEERISRFLAESGF